MMKLSKEQCRVLQRLEESDLPLTANELNCRISTLQALKSSGAAYDLGGWGHEEVVGNERRLILWSATHEVTA